MINSIEIQILNMTNFTKSVISKTTNVMMAKLTIVQKEEIPKTCISHSINTLHYLS